MSKKRNKNSRKKQLKSRTRPGSKVHHVKINDIRVLGSLDYTITDEPVEDEDFRALPEKVQEQIDDLHDLVQVSPLDTIEELQTLIKKYPHIPQLYNYLYTAYEASGQRSRANKIMRKNYDENPSYLFAKINYFEYLINQRKFKKAATIFDHKFHLTSLYPKRDLFHVSEVTAFNGVIGYYHAMTGQYHEAKRCLDILSAVSPVHMQTLRLERKLESLGKLAA